MKNIKQKILIMSAFLLIGATTFENVKAQPTSPIMSYEQIIKTSDLKNQKIQDWQELIKELKFTTALNEKEKVKLINKFWNKNLISSSDMEVWGKSDYWATPVESLTKGAGDCEDFVLGKYLSLLAIGVPEDKLKISYVKIRVGGLTSNVYDSHMVLQYESKNTTFILDNMVAGLKERNKRIDIVEVFSFDNSNIYVKGVYQASADTIKLWTDYKNRITQQGKVEKKFTASTKLRH